MRQKVGKDDPAKGMGAQTGPAVVASALQNRAGGFQGDGLYKAVLLETVDVGQIYELGSPVLTATCMSRLSRLWLDEQVEQVVIGPRRLKKMTHIGGHLGVSDNKTWNGRGQARILHQMNRCWGSDGGLWPAGTGRWRRAGLPARTLEAEGCKTLLLDSLCS